MGIVKSFVSNPAKGVIQTYPENSNRLLMAKAIEETSLCLELLLGSWNSLNLFTDLRTVFFFFFFLACM
jgi:hypothetical protein